MYTSFTKPLALAAACMLTVGCATASAHDHEETAGGESLKKLMEGNARFVNGERTADMSVEERAELAKGQSPYAIIVSCADSRVAPELAFDASPGELFVIRVAGNIVDDYELASIEYAVAVLESPLLVIMGHESCGAVDAAVKSQKDGQVFPGHIHDLVEAIRPAVRKAMEHEGQDTLMTAIKENVRLVVDQMENSQPIIGTAIKDGKLKVVPAVYDLDTGEVSVVSMNDKHHEGHDHADHNHGS
jgi:carbonic anhydrase